MYQYLLNKFFNSLLVELKTIPKEPCTPKKVSTSSNYVLSPNSKQIIKNLSPKSQNLMIKLLISDEVDDDYNDDNFNYKFDNNGLGFFMENFVSFYGNCPLCHKKTLRKFKYSNIPVIDLVCINEQHLLKNESFVFQLKISTGDSYFSLKNKIIKTGSKKMGELCHNVLANDSYDLKILVPNYICIKIKKNVDYHEICFNESFVLIPNLKNINDECFYNYKSSRVLENKLSENIISWNNKNVSCLNLNTVIKKKKIKYQVFEENDFENPYFISK